MMIQAEVALIGVNGYSLIATAVDNLSEWVKMSANPDWTDEDHQKKVAAKIACQMLGHHIINGWSYRENTRGKDLVERGVCVRCLKLVDVDG